MLFDIFKLSAYSYSSNHNLSKIRYQASASAKSNLFRKTHRGYKTVEENPTKTAERKDHGHQIARPGVVEDSFDETSYYFQNGLRKVYPYYFTYSTFTKRRWMGETVSNVFEREFQIHVEDKLFIRKYIQDGTLTVNNRSVLPDYKLKQFDLMVATLHRHETPVLDQPIKFIHIDDDVVVVDKPSSIPVHPCGRFRHNTTISILARENGFKNLHPVHRLDRLTSGILIFARNVQKVRQITQQIREHLVEKQYICRVEGEFPDGNIQCTEPVEDIQGPIGVARVSSTGKCSRTSFEKLSFNGRTSVVLCKPKTGRTHQIRVHLQYLGFPIINDPLYNHTVFGPLKGRGGDFGGKSEEQLIKDLAKIHVEDWLVKNETCQDNQSIATEALCNEIKDKFDPKKMTTDLNCLRCKLIDREPRPQELVMYLHALKYAGPGWSYETPLPEWANEDYDDNLEA